MDRRLYLPESWSTDPDRRELAGVPDDVAFATTPALASQMIKSALMAGAPARWVAGDEVYGADPGSRITCRRLGLSYVLAIGKNRTVTTHAGTKRADEVIELIPPDAWVRLSAGEGSKGHRWYSWAIVDILPEPDGPRPGSGHHTPARTPQRHHRRAGLVPVLDPTPGPRARPRARRRPPVDRRGELPGRQGPRRAGRAPGPPLGLLAPVDNHGLLADAFLTVLATVMNAAGPTTDEAGLIAVTLAEARRLFTTLLAHTTATTEQILA